MWTRMELKSRAKKALGGNYWPAFGISLVILLSGSSSLLNGSSWRESSNEMTLRLPFEMVAVIIGFGVLFSMAYRLFVGYFLEVGGRRWFIKLARDQERSGSISWAFTNGSYFRILVAMLLRDVLTFLWTLLLVIPGIVKYYAYVMTPFILAENPDMDSSEAIGLSMQMTKGHKMDIFILDLSFIGWYLLGTLALGIGVLFVEPYRNATYGELYLALKGEGGGHDL